ncbi:PAS domain-containing protein [Azospirillum sp. ST 5-10]|uniref:PAS domain-containing protein n=1 Tax=unclassified Azospirillum TaxID=2630922 RepID=UPI003F4A3B6C
MARNAIRPTGIESPFDDEEIIVTKTDLTGRIAYANDVFLRVSHYAAKDVVGAPHSIIRHPDMPRCVFKLLWDAIQGGNEIFAYVLNLAGNGDHYWVFAHVTPSRDASGRIVGYHSNRRKPTAEQVARIAPLYRTLRQEEDRSADRKEGLRRSHALLTDTLRDRGMDYDRFVFSL